MSVEKLINEELICKITDLQDLKVESQEYRVGVDSVTKLAKALVEMKEAEAEISAKEEETRLHEKEQKADLFDKIARNAIQFVAVGGGIVVTVWGTIKSLKFEETGVCTSTASKKFFGTALNFFKK